MQNTYFFPVDFNEIVSLYSLSELQFPWSKNAQNITLSLEKQNGNLAIIVKDNRKLRENYSDAT